MPCHHAASNENEEIKKGNKWSWRLQGGPLFNSMNDSRIDWVIKGFTSVHCTLIDASFCNPKLDNERQLVRMDLAM